MSNKITVIKGKVEEVKLPVPKVDIIISEWMGYFLLYESMLDSVLWARDKYLAPGGKMLPSRGDIFVAAVNDEKFKDKRVNFWKNVYGINMSCMMPTVVREPVIDLLDCKEINSSSCKLVEFDFDTVQQKDLEFSNTYSVTFYKPDNCHGIVAWFDTAFSNMKHEVILTTSPYKKATHWK